MVLRLLLYAVLNYFIFANAQPNIVHTSISCDKTDFHLKIVFSEMFSGMIFTEQGTPNCIYVNASIQRSTEYDLKIPLNGCETKRNSENNYENELIVQSGVDFNPKRDKKFLLTCIPANPIFRDSQVTVAFGGITIDTDVTTVATLEGSPKIEYNVLVRDGDEPTAPPLNRPLSVGDKVAYTVHLLGSVKGRLGRCWASDGQSELELSGNDGCSLQRAGEVWGDFEVSRDDSGTLFVNHIKAWAFPTSNEVNIFCNLHVCATCEQADCRNVRRRRVAFRAISHDEPLDDLPETAAPGRGTPSRPTSGPSDPFSSPVDMSDLDRPIPLRTSFRLRRSPNIEESASQRWQPNEKILSTSAGVSSATAATFSILSLMVLMF